MKLCISCLFPKVEEFELIVIVYTITCHVASTSPPSVPSSIELVEWELVCLRNANLQKHESAVPSAVVT
ncbi:hypothetical protein VNO78_33773 [Psophocarpus tetragonolobus]|uniref:Uncharacterized protein n=1 Tax=Psophocarpus tetragonolobus TaxID=3891 RepID=A0AAN9NXL3_PSOTE